MASEKRRGSSEALYLIRRAITAGESSQTKTFLLLLHWEKAFDKITHKGLISAMTRMNIDMKLIRMIERLYGKATFYVEIDGVKSSTYKQKTGIRQGCPLSPYLFLIVMTAMFRDIHENDKTKTRTHRVGNANFEEVLFADDTICTSENARALSRLLQEIEKEGDEYGLILNYDKCELISIHRVGPRSRRQSTFQKQTRSEKQKRSEILRLLA